MKNVRAVLAAPLLLSIALLSGCGGEDDASASPRTGSAGTSASPSTGSEETPAPTESTEPESSAPSGGGSSGGSGGGSSGGSGGGTSGGSGGGTVPTPPPTTADPTPPPHPGWPPPEAPAVHGGSAWGVYLVVAPGPSPELDRAYAEVRSLGLEGAAILDVGCDVGAAEALGVDPGHQAVAVHFATREDAEWFLARYPESFVGYAQVVTSCLD